MELVRQKAYRKTLEIACSRLAGLPAGLPIEERLKSAGLPFLREGDAYSVEMRFFDEDIELTIPAFAFKSARGSNITLTTKIILLHYIMGASGEPIGSDLIPYEDIPGCRAYAPVFERRVTRPLLSAFGFARDAFSEAGSGLGAQKAEYGDVSFTLQALPRVPITFILWEGDTDFPPSMKVLFDRSIHTYLPLEDIVVISKMAATRIIKEARKEYVGD
jgi:Domain of unknown function (DUF3786)